MTFYKTREQHKEFPGFYNSLKELPQGYIIELMKKIIENKNKKNPLENKISLN